MADKNRAKQKAKEIIKKYGIEEPIVEVFDIAKREGLQIKFVEMTDDLVDVAGFLNDKVIYVNELDPPYRQTFTVAHELGHYLLHNPNESDVLYRYQKFNGASQIEREANYFAACLLVPKKMLNKVMKEYNLDKGDEYYLSRLFGVSKEMMRYRLKEV